ncbi:MAG: hypothetical protein WBR26_16355 [Candidatus Acidiferrum sp.]
MKNFWIFSVSGDGVPAAAASLFAAISQNANDDNSVPISKSAKTH